MASSARPKGIAPSPSRRDPNLTVADVLTAKYLAAAQRKGMNAEQIARATGFTGDTVTRHLRAHGLPVGPPSPKVPVDARRLAALMTKGVPTIPTIAATFGCSVAVIQQRIVAYGIRPKAPAHRRYAMPPERLAEMKAEGWTQAEMAAEFWCHCSTVSLRLARLGLRRPYGARTSSTK
jgi:hypothetical protein